MWARRCGCQPLWPSRIKVLAQSIAVATVGLTVFQFGNDIDVGYLDISRPSNSTVLCLDHWPLRHKTWGGMEFWIDWSATNMDVAEFFTQHKCSQDVNVTSCSSAVLPLAETHRPLGIPLGERFRKFNDYIESFAHYFLYLSLWNWIFVTVHDLALLSRSKRDYVLDLRGIDKHFPCARKLYQFSGFQWMRRLMRGKLRGKRNECPKNVLVRICLAVLVMPFFILWVMTWFCVLLFFGTACFVRYPVRLSRAMIFVSCLMLALLGIVVAVGSLVAVAREDVRQNYAVTWCVYPITAGNFVATFLLGVGIVYKALMLAFKCLKGLRQSNWASLMSVMFPVPLNVYSVHWTRPNGDPIQHRRKDEPVQGEMAFDPFALMDEQPESNNTALYLYPALVSKVALRERAVALDFQGADVSTGASDLSESVRTADVAAKKWKASKMDDEGDSFNIGCCGFPCSKGAVTVEGSSSDSCTTKALQCREKATALRDQAARATMWADELDEQAADFDAKAMTVGAKADDSIATV